MDSSGEGAKVNQKHTTIDTERGSWNLYMRIANGAGGSRARNTNGEVEYGKR